MSPHLASPGKHNPLTIKELGQCTHDFAEALADAGASGWRGKGCRETGRSGDSASKSPKKVLDIQTGLCYKLVSGLRKRQDS